MKVNDSSQGNVLSLPFLAAVLPAFVAGILTIILGCLFLKEGMDVMKALSILIVFGGIGVMFASNAGGGNLRGIALPCWQVPATPSLFS